MGEREITRRQVLAGVAGVGGVGSVLGGGTAALYTEGETFGGSRFKSGTVDLAVEVWGREQRGEGDIDVRLELEETQIANSEESNQSGVAESRGTKESTADSDGTATPEEPDEEPTPTETATETATPEPTATPEDTPTLTPEETGTVTPEETGTATPEETGTATPEETGTVTPEETGTATATPGDKKSDNGTSRGGGRVGTMGVGQEEQGVSFEGDSSVWRDDFKVTVELPYRDGENNAAFGWIGAPCPKNDFEENLRVTIQYADGGSEDPLYEDSFAGLAGGIPLDPDGGVTADGGEQRCFEPPDEEGGQGDAVTLEIVVEHEEPKDNDETTFTLEFVGRQCRYDQATNPFPEDPDCDTHEDGDEEAFSFVGFCSSSHGSIDPTFERLERRGQLDAVAWSTQTPVDFVVVKKATWYTVYDLRDDDPADEGILAWKDPDADVPSEPMASGSPSEHCSVAVEAVDATDYDGENTEKVEWKDVTWEEDQ